MKKFISICILLAAVLPVGITAKAQTMIVNKKPGAVSSAELQMTSYPKDTSAAAVLLYTSQKRYVTYNSGYPQMVTKHFQRIKILKESGREYADFEIFLNTKSSPSDLLSGVKVVTYNLEDGKVVQSKLTRDHIYESKQNDFSKKVNFAAENVKVGSVVEAQWETTVRFRYRMPDMIVQAGIPINYGEMEVSVPDFLKFTLSLQGVDITHCEIKQKIDGGSNSVDTYVIKDMPSFKAEPRMIAPYQYLARGEYAFKWYGGGLSDSHSNSWTGYGTYKLSGIHNGTARRFFNSDWASIDEDLAESGVFEVMYGPCQFKKEVDEIVAMGLSNEQTVCQIRRKVLEKINWNEEIDLVPESGLMTALSRKGTSADINAIMSTCLVRAGFQVSPLFLKLRSSGKITTVDVDEYDTFVLYAQKDGDVYVFDAADGNGYLNVLPEDMLVSDARLVDMNKKGQWMDPSGLCGSTESHMVQANLKEDGELEVSVTMKFQGSSAYDFKSFYASCGDDEKFMDTLQQKLNGYTVESCEIVSGKQWSPDFVLKLKLSQTVPVTGNQFMVNPFIRDFFSFTDFKSETRRLPVEFDYKEDVKYNFVLTIPQGYTVAQIPQNYFLYGEQLDCRVRVMSARSSANMVSMQFALQMNKNIVPANQYAQFRTFWDKLCNIFKERVVISKN